MAAASNAANTRPRPPQQADALDLLIAKLESGAELTSHDRLLALQLLKRLRETKGGRKSVETPAVQLRASTVEQLMAADYAAQKAKVSRSGMARKVVADVWSQMLGRKVKRGAVMAAFVAHRQFAQSAVEKYLAGRTGEREVTDGDREGAPIGRASLLDAFSKEIRDRHRGMTATGQTASGDVGHLR